MTAPHTLMNGPFEVYIFPIAADGVVEAAPDVWDAPAGNWALLGASGNKDITEDGIMVRSEQTQTLFRGLGSIGRRKMFRTEQDVIVEFTLADASIENFARTLNSATVDLTTSLRRRVQLEMSAEVAQFSLLLRGDGKSPYGAGWNTQWWVPRASHDGNFEAKYVKGEPVGILYHFAALIDDDYGFGYLESQDEDS